VKYCCDQCDFSSTRQDYLREHKKSKHEALKNIVQFGLEPKIKITEGVN